MIRAKRSEDLAQKVGDPLIYSYRVRIRQRGNVREVRYIAFLKRALCVPQPQMVSFEEYSQSQATKWVLP